MVPGICGAVKLAGRDEQDCVGVCQPNVRASAERRGGFGSWHARADHLTRRQSAGVIFYL